MYVLMFLCNSCLKKLLEETLLASILLVTQNTVMDVGKCNSTVEAIHSERAVTQFSHSQSFLDDYNQSFLNDYNTV